MPLKKPIHIYNIWVNCQRRREWYEFWVIFQFLKKRLQDNNEESCEYWISFWLLILLDVVCNSKGARLLAVFLTQLSLEETLPQYPKWPNEPNSYLANKLKHSKLKIPLQLLVVVIRMQTLLFRSICTVNSPVHVLRTICALSLALFLYLIAPESVIRTLSIRAFRYPREPWGESVLQIWFQFSEQKRLQLDGKDVCFATVELD